MAGGTWDPLVDKERAGLYINIVNTALAGIQAGERGTVAILVRKPLAGNAVADRIYQLYSTDQGRIIELFGESGVRDTINMVFMAGAKEVLVYVLPPGSVYDATEFVKARAVLDAWTFNVFVNADSLGSVSAIEQDETVLWQKSSFDQGKPFFVVFGGTSEEDLDPAVGNARTARLKSDFSVNLIVGGTVSGKEYSSAQYAPYIAGLIAGTALNKSTTFKKVSLENVNVRLTNAQIITALKAGSFVLIHDGEKVKVERGIATSGAKIRKKRAHAAFITDLTKAANSDYIGEIDNHVDGQKALIAAFKAYFETMAQNNVITDEIIVKLHPDHVSAGDKVFIYGKVTEVDSMEEIYLTIEGGAA